MTRGTEDSRLPVKLLTNINHISNKLDELYVLTRNCSPSIIALVETFLDSSTLDEAVTMSTQLRAETGHQVLAVAYSYRPRPTLQIT